MEWFVEQRPAYSILKIILDPGESVTAEAGAMMLMKGDVDIKTHTGGVGRALLRRIAGGEAVFLNTYTAKSQSELWFAPGIPGDINDVKISGEPWLVQDSSYLAHSGNIKIGVAWRGLKGLIAEGELIWLKLEGHGIAWINGYGGIERVELGIGEKITIDNFHFVAMPASTKYKIRKFGGWKSFFLGGEGFVVEVEGPTVLYLQTRILPPLAYAIRKFIGGRG